MFETLNRLYNEGKIASKDLTTAKNRGWITVAQVTEIKTKG